MTDWKDSARKRKIVRQSKGPDDPVPIPAKKDKKRWCGGKVGREHQLACMPYSNDPRGYFKDWRVLACKVCGKRVDHYYPWRYDNQPNPKPDWVTS